MERQILCFNSVGKEIYGIDVFVIEEVRVTPEITAIPNMPPWILGIISVRGHLATVVDFSALFNRGKTDNPALLILIEHEDQHFGLTANTVDAIYSIKEEDIVKKEQSGLSIDTVKIDEKIISLVSVGDLVKRINYE